jgi:hypothetical protein
MYKEFRDQMRTGDLLQWSSNSLIGTAIRWRTKSEYSHSSLVIRLKEYEGLERRVFTAESLEGSGCGLKLLSRRIEEYDGKVWWFPLDPKYNSLRQAIGEAAFERMGIPYDYESLIKQLIAKVSTEAHALFCSEYCYWTYGTAGLLFDGWQKLKAPNPGEVPKLGLFGERGRLK